jgi:hypothetical protein
VNINGGHVAVHGPAEEFLHLGLGEMVCEIGRPRVPEDVRIYPFLYPSPITLN